MAGELECAEPHFTGSVIPSVARDLGGMRSDRCPLYVYILSSQTRVLYTGSTNDLHRRLYQHKAGLFPGFTQEYHTTSLVYFECHASIRAGVERERKIKSWRRAKKLALIEQSTPAGSIWPPTGFRIYPGKVPRCARDDGPDFFPPSAPITFPPCPAIPS